MNVLVDPVYNPNLLNPNQINSATKLAPGVTIAKFLGAYGDRTSFNHITSSAARQQIARQLYLQAELYRSINGNTDMFNDVRLIVSEGLYRAGPEETIGGDNIKKADGVLVGYQVVNREGKIDHERTYEVAEFWKDNVFYDKLTLAYDTLNPDGSLTSQILIEMPKANESFTMDFRFDITTTYNDAEQSRNELTEVLSN